LQATYWKYVWVQTTVWLQWFQISYNLTSTHTSWFLKVVYDNLWPNFGKPPIREYMKWLNFQVEWVATNLKVFQDFCNIRISLNAGTSWPRYFLFHILCLEVIAVLLLKVQFYLYWLYYYYLSDTHLLHSILIVYFVPILQHLVTGWRDVHVLTIMQAGEQRRIQKL